MNLHTKNSTMWRLPLWMAGLLALPACSWNPPADSHVQATVGVVQSVIDPHTQADQLPPCLASRLAQLRGGTRFVAIRYRHWASHFNATTYAALDEDAPLPLHQAVQIVPGRCAHDELAIILGPAPSPITEGETP